MSLSTRMIVVLTAIGLISGGVLAGVGLLTKQRIFINRQRETEKAITQVVPGTSSSQKIYEEKDFTVYAGKNNEGRPLGFAVQSTAGGFQDKIAFIFGTNVSLTKINSLYILDQKETPGLGAKITSQEFFLRFWENKDISRPLSLRRPPVSTGSLSASEVNAITGATVSSEAMLGSVNAALEKIKKLVADKKIQVEGLDAK